MPAKIKHIAIVSGQYALEGRFYEAVFGMRTAADRRPERAVTVSDGYVGLNINPRKAGRPAGLDHFGVEVGDAEQIWRPPPAPPPPPPPPNPPPPPPIHPPLP